MLFSSVRRPLVTITVTQPNTEASTALRISGRLRGAPRPHHTSRSSESGANKLKNNRCFPLPGPVLWGARHLDRPINQRSGARVAVESLRRSVEINTATCSQFTLGGIEMATRLVIHLHPGLPRTTLTTAAAAAATAIYITTAVPPGDRRLTGEDRSQSVKGGGSGQETQAAPTLTELQR
ncbi:unnamed protein product [Lota lota]